MSDGAVWRGVRVNDDVVAREPGTIVPVEVAKGKCLIWKCEKPPHRRGYCRSHYQYILKHQRSDLIPFVRPHKVCQLCSNRAKGTFCLKCYKENGPEVQAKRRETRTRGPARKSKPFCEQCSEPATKGRLCVKCYYREYRKRPEVKVKVREMRDNRREHINAVRRKYRRKNSEIFNESNRKYRARRKEREKAKAGEVG